MGKDCSGRIAKPQPGQRIKNYKVKEANIKNFPSGFLNAPVVDWTQPTKLVANIDTTKCKGTTSSQALQHIRECFKAISISSNSSTQLARYASNCYDYSNSDKFKRDFLEAYTARKVSLEDSEIREATQHLASRGMSAAAAITERSFDPLVSSAIEHLDGNARNDGNAEDMVEEHEDEVEEIEEDDLEKLWRDIPENAARDFFAGPAPLANHTPEKPKLTIMQIQQLRSRCQVALSGTPLSLMTPALRDIREKNATDQQSLASLKSFHNAFQCLAALMKNDVPYDTFPLSLWTHQSQSGDWNENERSFFRVIALTLTDFWGISTRRLFDQDAERSFWVESVVPMFKYLGASNNLIVFSWCESMVVSHNKSQIIPGIWKNDTDKLFADGVGRDGDSEMVLMESSSCYSAEKIDHTMSDTWKLIMMSTDSLRMELLKYQDGSFDTAKELAIFGVQCVKGTITLLKTTIHDEHAWRVVELRSAQIPTQWVNRVEFMKVFELLCTLHIELQKQQDIRSTLLQEKNLLLPVEFKDTIRYRLKESNIIIP